MACRLLSADWKGELNMKHTIWQNTDLDIDEFRKTMAEDYPEMAEHTTDNEVARLMYEHNWDWLADERINLDIDTGSEIVCIADIGRWNGRVRGYKLIHSGNIKDCLYLSEDCGEGAFYVDDADKDLHCTEHHHDGTNYLRFRAFRKGVTDRQRDYLLESLYCTTDSCEDLLQKYTKPIGPAIAKVYGWKLGMKTA